MADVSSMSIKELKALIAEAGLSVDGCIEKADLRTRAAEAQAKLAQKVGNGRAASAPVASRTLGRYECVVLAPDEVLAGHAPADLAVILLHGLGAGSNDLANLATALPGLTRKILFVCPQAPPHPMFGSAWWTIDPMKFLALSTADEATVASAIREEPPDLGTCRKQMADLLADVRQLGGGAEGMLPASRVVLGGFSQGAITSLDVALQCAPEERLAGVLFLSGAPLVVEQWAALLKNHRGLRVLMAHGLADPTLPVKASKWVLDLLKQGGADVIYKQHAGGHDIGDQAVIAAIVKFVNESGLSEVC